MDRDLKQVLAVFAVVVSFGGGYFLNQWQNKEKIETGEKFAAMNSVEDALKTALGKEISYGQKAMDAAVTAYYGAEDKYFTYASDSAETEQSDEAAEEKEDFYTMYEDICYISYNHFEVAGSRIFLTAYEECDEKSKAYIIDLRGNTGGTTQVAANILGNFVGKRDICTLYSYNGEIETYKSTDDKMFDKPIVVLVDGGTASSSEIFAATLKQYYPEATLIGMNTKGKGVFQQFDRIDDNATIRYTAGYYTVGEWECYQDIGIAPDIEVEMDSQLIGTDEDVQLQAAIDYLNGRQID